MRIDSKDLDAWARALGVSNDAHAMAALRKLSRRMLRLAGEIAQTRQQLIDGGLPDRNPAMDDFLKSAAYTLDAGLALGRVGMAFARHERGAA
ncbi:hypothetical protein NBCG_00589 [Nocardioidaceae bacterium Broad-1]|nr:hypothetical protein NBCG_00589 [Nocardioidaceae bacterium Broad-1]